MMLLPLLFLLAITKSLCRFSSCYYLFFKKFTHQQQLHEPVWNFLKTDFLVPDHSHFFIRFDHLPLCRLVWEETAVPSGFQTSSSEIHVGALSKHWLSRQGAQHCHMPVQLSSDLNKSTGTTVAGTVVVNLATACRMIDWIEQFSADRCYDSGRYHLLHDSIPKSV